MRRLILLLVPLLLCSFVALPALGAGDDQPVYREPLGIALEGWPPPFPVEFLPLTIEGHDLRMAYMDVAAAGSGEGKAEAPSVVLLHGKNFFGDYWRDTATALSQAGFRVVIPDQIGFGRSSKPDDIHYSFDLLAANTAGLLDHLKIRKAAIVGHSMGGMLAVRFARNYPDRTSHLILANPIGLEDYRMVVPPTPLGEVYRQELTKSPAATRAYVKTYFPKWKPEYEKLVEPLVRVQLSGEFPRWAMSSALTYQMIYQQPVRHEFSLIRVPTLLVIGQADRTAIGRNAVSPEVGKTMGNYPELGRAAARDIKGADLVEIEGVGHLPHIETPQRFQEAVLTFLKK